MTLTVEAVYENGVLRPVERLPLKENEHVQLCIQTLAAVQSAARRPSGLIRWTGSVEDLDYLIEDGENDPLEGP